MPGQPVASFCIVQQESRLRYIRLLVTTLQVSVPWRLRECRSPSRDGTGQAQAGKEGKGNVVETRFSPVAVPASRPLPRPFSALQLRFLSLSHHPPISSYAVKFNEIFFYFFPTCRASVFPTSFTRHPLFSKDRTPFVRCANGLNSHPYEIAALTYPFRN